MLKQIKQLIAGEQGAETIEYALVIGLIVVGVIGIAAAVGRNVLAYWSGVDGAM